MQYAVCTTEERYLRAICTSRLTIDVDTTADIDQLIAAGIVGASSRRMGLALTVYRWRAGDAAVGETLADELGILMRNEALRALRKGGLVRAVEAKPFSPAAMRSTAMAVMSWWRDDKCKACEGRGHPTLPLNDQVVDETRDCQSCSGTGRRPLERSVRQEHRAIAQWMVSEMEGTGSDAFWKMRSLTRPRASGPVSFAVC